MSFYDDISSGRNYINAILVGGFLLVGIPYILIVNWPYWMNKIDPYSDLSGKVAVDGIDLELYGYSGDENEIYLVDTVENSYRQLTSDSYNNDDPYLSLDENKIYFFSSKPHNLGTARRYDFLYAYSLTTHEIEEIRPD